MRAPATLQKRPRLTDDENGAHRAEVGARLVPAARRRSTPAIILAVLSIAGGALAGVIAYKASSGRHSVLAASHAIAAGHVIQATDLNVVDVSSDGGLTLVSATDEDSVLGRPAGVPIAAGALLTRSEVGSVSVARAGEAIVGVLCKAGQYPPSLASGDTVEIIDSGASGLSAAGGGPTTGSESRPLEATVIGVDAPTDTATVGTIISLRLSASDAPAVSRAAAAGRVSLILVPPGG